jgi:hypothetical protein
MGTTVPGAWPPRGRAGDEDDDAEGRLVRARVAALGAEAVVAVVAWNKKQNCVKVNCAAHWEREVAHCNKIFRNVGYLSAFVS